MPGSGGPHREERVSVGRPRAAFETRERRIDIEPLGLEVVGRSAPDPRVLMHLGLRGELEAAFCCYESAYVEGDLDVRVRASLPYAKALEQRGDVARAFALVETLFELGLGTPTWRASAEARLRRLSRRAATAAA